MHLSRRAQDHGIDVRQFQRFAQVRKCVLDAVLLRLRASVIDMMADEADDFDVIDIPDAIQVLDAERTHTGQYCFHSPFLFISTTCQPASSGQ